MRQIEELGVIQTHQQSYEGLAREHPMQTHLEHLSLDEDLE